MRKFLVMMLLLFLLNSVSYGATSEDASVYVRQDVFDAKMEALFIRLHSEIETLGNKINGRIDALSAEMNGKISALSSEVKGDLRELSARIDGIEKRMDTMNTFLYYLLVLFGALLLLPVVNKLWESREKSSAASSVTLEDVKRLIAEAKLSGISQVQA